MSGGTWVKARGLKDRNPFTQRVVQQTTYVRLHYKADIVNALCGHDVDILKIKPGGTYSTYGNH